MELRHGAAFQQGLAEELPVGEAVPEDLRIDIRRAHALLAHAKRHALALEDVEGVPVHERDVDDGALGRTVDAT